MNSANQANFDEIQGHIKIIKAKMAKSGDAQGSLAEDLEDYYERQLQLRVMRANDLAADLKAAQENAVGLRRRLWRLGIGWVALVTIALMCVAATLFPSQAQKILYSDALKWGTVMCGTTGLGSAATWYALRAPKGKTE
tara:strand:- start:4699 stop:5115 length:417 start_codon:yes stop_codon:yes gene_type:complete